MNRLNFIQKRFVRCGYTPSEKKIDWVAWFGLGASIVYVVLENRDTIKEDEELHKKN